MRLNVRMLIYILTTSVIIFSVGIGYISFRYRSKAKADAVSLTDALAMNYANIIKSEMDRDFGVSRGMAQAMLAVENSKSSNKEAIQTATMVNVLKQNPSYIAAFLQWDLSDCMPGYNKFQGRRRYFVFRKVPDFQFNPSKNEQDDAEIEVLTGIVDTGSYDKNNAYYLVKEQLNEYIIDPYFYTYSHIEAMPQNKPESEKSVLETTLIVPITEGNKFRALAGVDIPLNHFREMAKNIKPFRESYAFIVSNNGTIVAHPADELIGQILTDYVDKEGIEVDILASIKEGRRFSFTQDFGEKGVMYYSLAPVQIGNTKTPWTIGIRVPMDVIMADANRHFFISILVGFIGLVILSIVIWQISLNITRPIRSTTVLLKEISEGKIGDSVKLHVKTHDEIAEMAHSANILLDGFRHTADFAYKIGEGDLGADYELLSSGDILGKALVEMRNKLKQAQQDIEKNNHELEKLSKVAQKTDNAVLILDKNGKPEWVNDAFTKMYGYNLEELNEMYGGNIIKFSSHPQINEFVNTCISEKKSVYYDSMIRARSGKEVYAQTTISPIMDETGEVVRIVAIDSDISDIKLAQEEIRAQRDQLENQRNELEKLNATKDKFFSILAHDLKNPFSGLHSMSEMLSANFKQIDDDDKSKLADKINENAKHIFDLLEDLLTWSRLQRGQMEYNPVKFNLSQLIDINLNVNKLAADKKQIALIAKNNGEICAFADRDMINAVVRNLVNNAVKFTGNMGTIEVDARPDSDGFVHVAVADNGIGISEEDQAKLFRIDIKTKSIGKSKEKGTGLGLILCKEFVEKNGGTIWVESEEGKGSCFRFTVKMG